MTKALIFILLFARLVVSGQADTSVILSEVLKLEKALVSKDSITLKKLLHPDVAYGHSNGWVQMKPDILEDMRRGYLVYGRIENQSISINLKKKKAFVKERITVEGTVNGTAFKLNLFVLQLWVRTKKGWQMLSRQSAKQ